MKVMKRCLILFLLLNTVLISAAAAQLKAQSTAQLDAAFSEGVILYNNGNFKQAEKIFRDLISIEPPHHLITAALIMHAKSSYWLGNYAQVQKDIKRLLTLHPTTRYLDQAHLLMGLIHYKTGDAYKAAKQFILAFEHADSEQMAQKVKSLARILLRDYLTPEQLEQLKAESFGAKGNALIVLAQAEHLMQQNNPARAQSLIENYLKIHQQSPLAADLTAFLKDRIQKVLNVNRIGVLLPLTGVFSEEGRRLAAGIKFAEQQARSRQNGKLNVQTVILDTGSNMIRAIKQLQELQSDPNVICLIGELENIITAGLAGMAQTAGIPFVAPVASDNGLADIGPYVFQASPDLETRAKALARYAYLIDSLRTFITIAPHDEYGQQMVDAFSEEIDRLGGEIIAQRWYFGVPENLGRQFKDIREIAFRRALEDTLRPKLPNFAQLDKDSLWNDFLQRFMIETDEKESIVELNSAYPVTNIDGVFLPIYREDIEYVARQLRYFNIDAKILGGEYWYITELDKKKQLLRYIDNTVFVSSYYYDPQGLAYQNFRNRFRQAMGLTPEKWELIGYDVANFIFSFLSEEKISRTAMHQHLLAAGRFSGYRGEIYFSPERRVNQAVHILQIRGNKIVRLPIDDVLFSNQ